MATNDSIFSIRLVIADFYMEKPVAGLDPVYSEFRGKEIKRVPIVRIFGSNSNGQKTCMHVHGVFPYFYIPYDQKDFESVNKAIYQIAINLDKAINISLSQGSSAAQHVFKVQLVKGIPFYGYHRSEHQYLKIYMFNPRFVRRAANLLQNGAIMNKGFHPHEAHVPYILQFMIDYNLYGMSFLHVPSEIVKFRRHDANDEIPFENLKEAQILDFNLAKKLSCSSLECDIGSNFILNRFQLIAKTNTSHTNPGIESIWNDERLRRQNLAQTLEDEEKINAIPPLEVPATQERPNVYPTDSETFYRSALVAKLLSLETSMADNSQLTDETINCTQQSNATNINLNLSLATMKQQKRTFNLSKILQNAVYPEECSQNQNLVNASFVQDHLSSNNAFEQSLNMSMPKLVVTEDQPNSQDDSVFLEDTIVDEELVLSLTQSQQLHVPHNATLRDEDKDLLDILQELEENNDDKIDLDSSLAPLSQNHKKFELSPELLDKETTASIMQQPSSEAESDEENDSTDNVHDFSIALDNLDDLILKLTQSQSKPHIDSSLPQTDGSDDLPKTPSKSLTKAAATKTPPRTPTTPRQRRLTMGSPSRSPRTPKSGHKYKPLPLIITNRSTGIVFKITSAETTPGKNVLDTATNLPSVPLRKKLALTEMRRKSISIESEVSCNQIDLEAVGECTNGTKRRSRRIVDLDKTHITCNLTPRRTNEKLLKVYSVEKESGALLKNHNEDETQNSISIKRKEKNINPLLENLKETENRASEIFKEKKQLVGKVKESVASTINITEDKNVDVSIEDDDDEIENSDSETEYPSLQMRKTPNLKRLRRSFLATRSAKRRRIACESEDIVNSSKFENRSSIINEKLYEQSENKIEDVLKSSENVQQVIVHSLSNNGPVENVELISDTNSKAGNENQLDTAQEINKKVEIKNDIVKPKTPIIPANNPHHSRTSKNSTTQSKSATGAKNHKNVERVLRKSKRLDSHCQYPELKPQNQNAKVVNTNIFSESEDLSNLERQQHINSLKKCKVRLKKLNFIKVKSIEVDEKSMKSSFEIVSKHSHKDSNEMCKTIPGTEDLLKKSTEKPHKQGEERRNVSTAEMGGENQKLSEVFGFVGSIKEFPEKINDKPPEVTNENINLMTVSSSADSIEELQQSLRTLQKVSNKSMEKPTKDNSSPSEDDNDNEHAKSLCTSESTKQSSNASNNDNLLKSLLKFSEWQLSNSPSTELSHDIPLAQTSAASTQSSTIEFAMESPLAPSSDEEISETPPLPNETDYPKSLTSHRKSMLINSPMLFTPNSSPSLLPPNKTIRNSRINSASSCSREPVIFVSSSGETITKSVNISPTPPLGSRVILTPLDIPPTREEVLKGCLKFQLHEYEFQQPYYSNPDDVTKQKEIGFTVLQIPSNKLNDLEEFQSILGCDVNGLASWRRKQLLKLGGPEMLTKYRNTQRIREYFASQKTVAITPQINAPSRHDVKLWLKARELLKNKDGANGQEEDKSNLLNEDDSPIKVRRQKVTLMMNAGGDGDGDGSGDDCDASLDCSSRSLSMTPLTPATPLSKASQNEEINKSFTPVTTKLEKIPLERLKHSGKYNKRRILKRISLRQKLNDVLGKSKSSESQGNPEETEVLPAIEESIGPQSQTSESSVSSQTALAEMERSSFMRQLGQHDVTMGPSGNNSTLDNTFGFKVALENLQQAKADIELNYLTIITLEVFVVTREDLFPNPEIDEIRCLFYAIENSIPNDHAQQDKKLPRNSCGYIMVHDSRDTVGKEGRIHGIDRDIEVTIVQTEVEALEALLGLCSRWDADIYAGYEIEMSSWGFVIERAKYLCLNIAPMLSRVPTQKIRDFVDEDREQFTDLDVEMKLCGRILLDVWRLMRSEIALTSYTFENVMYHIMHKRCPWHSYRTLSEWFASPCSRWIVIEYYLERVRGTLSLLDQLDLIGRTSEMAKLIGIQFYEVLSRGSQFRVESMMLRIAKPKNLVPLSPSVQQRAHMRAPEYLPLILEPQSRFYADPLIVLDFQSLYPSMIIGYNYCFSTCLGRVEHLGQSTPFEFGASQLRVSPTMLRKLIDRDLITISPGGIVFVKSSVREGILPRMLTEILDTRQMVKQSMKVHKSNSALQRILHSRQLGLKLMANVTYGYTAANFSGRMPAVEVGDTVVAKGRETLERAIKMVEANEKWNVKVVYGDTDSLFVLVPGRNREEAFRIGEEISEAVTKQNPHPVKLKLEKVYQPCILQTKKRYVGYMYETADQKEPVYEAKGIETVRRDGCPMVAKMLEKVLRILFETADVSQVKSYVCRQFTKLLSGRANLQDLIFAKEFRGMNGYKPTACVPALELTRKWLQNDPRRIPRRGERVPFIITNGPPGVPLIRLIRHPHEVLADEGLKINAIYYITKAIIPPLNRCMLLIGADVNEWFANLPRKILMTPALSVANEVISCPANSRSKKSTISQFFSTTNCIVDCGRQTKQGICECCNSNATRSMIILHTKIAKIERGFLTTQHICQACCGRVGDLKCGSLDCPVLYVLEVKRRELQQITHFRNLLEERF